MTADNDGLFAAGYYYAEKQRTANPGMTVAEQKTFAKAYADNYASEGLSPAEAWKRHTGPG